MTGLTAFAILRPVLRSFLVLTLLTSTGILAQDSDSSEDNEKVVFGETINVSVVNVDVWVTDKDGNPVHDLKASDFELYEDKRPLTITNFHEYRAGEEVGEAAPKPQKKPKDREQPILSHPALQGPEVPEDQRLSLMVYVDHFNIQPQNRNRVFRYLRQFLRTKLDREDRVAMVSYNRSMKVEHGFTSDPVLIANATYDLEEHTGGRTLQTSDRADLLTEMGRDTVNYDQMVARVRMYAQNQFNELQFTIDGLREAVSQLAGIPGRKALLYVSEGLPMRAGEDLFWALEERFRDNQQATETGIVSTQSLIMESFRYDASRMFDEVGSLANANRVTFYTLDAAGLRVGGMRSAEYAATHLSSNIDSIYNRGLQDAIVYLADRTGGQSIINTNNMTGGFERFASDFDNRYSLGFQPSHAASGRRYKLEVKLKKSVGKGLRVRSRDSYQDKPVIQEMGDATLAALAFGYQSNPLGVRVDLAEGSEAMLLREDGTYMTTFEVRIPIGSVTLVPSGDNFEAKVRTFVQAIDEKGRTSIVQQEDVAIVVPKDQLEAAREQFWVHSLKLLMKDGEQKVAVGVRDDLTAQSSLLLKTLVVG